MWGHVGVLRLGRGESQEKLSGAVRESPLQVERGPELRRAECGLGAELKRFVTLP